MYTGLKGWKAVNQKSNLGCSPGHSRATRGGDWRLTVVTQGQPRRRLSMAHAARGILPSWPCEFDSRHPLHRKIPNHLPLSSARGPKDDPSTASLGASMGLIFLSLAHLASLRSVPARSCGARLTGEAALAASSPTSETRRRPQSSTTANAASTSPASSQHAWRERISISGILPDRASVTRRHRCSPPRPAQRPAPSAATSLPSGCRSDLVPSRSAAGSDQKMWWCSRCLGGVRGNPPQCPRYCHWG
jgi:hypothetical protein